MKYLFSVILFTIFSVSQTLAQTITIHDFAPGIYTPGSSIAVPFTLGSSATCIQQDNKFNLYLADALGNVISPGTPIGTFSGFYGTFVNGVIPAGTAAGTYTVVVKSTNPVITSAPSPVFTVGPGAVVTAGITGTPIATDVFGNCNGIASAQYFFNDASSTNSSIASFFNESSQTIQGAPVILGSNSNSSFTAQATNYTIMVTATNAGTIGTRAYTLLNNVLNNSFGVSNGSTVCLIGTSGGTLSYNVDITSANGIQNNFPGTTYQVSWGDGLTSSYTYCDIKNLNGQIVHTYTSGSCGHTANSHNNSFEVDIQPQSPYCSNAVSAVTTYAKVLQAPTNGISSVHSACTNTAVTFGNASNPGQDPSNNITTCVNNPNARYIWSVDGVVKLTGALLSTPFTYTFTTHGVHYVTLALQSGSTGVCTAAPVTDTICVQDPPQPAFTIPSPACLSTPVIPTDASILDLTCSTASSYTYLWTVTGPVGAPAVTFAPGTTKNSIQPKFVFTQPGVYQVQLSISSTSCATTSTSQTINVDGPPVITLSPNATVCGTNQTYTFGPGGGITQASVTGTAQYTASTYNWTITGGPYAFANGTDFNSQYPQITFTGFGTYTIKVTEQNSCGTVTSTPQTITFQNAPTVSVSSSNTTPICPGTSVTLTGAINGTSTSFQWVGSGTFSAPGSLITDYTPTAAEINSGHATVRLDVSTGLTGQCSHIIQTVIIDIYPVNNITSAATKQVCTGNAVNYHITSSASGSTYSWAVALTSGTATGFANGGGPDITDVLVNNGPGDAVVTYIITPTANGCTGTPFTLTVTVKPQATVTAVPVKDPICSGSPAGINLTPNIAGTTYTWTSTVTGSITGNTQRTTQISTGVINDVLNNSGTTAGTVTYIITPFNTSCPGTPVTVTLNVLPLPATSRPGTNTEICNQTTYTLDGNNPPSGSGMWSVVPVGTVTFSDPAQPGAIASGLVPGTTYSFTWTISIPGCNPPSSNSVIITDNLPTVGGTINGDATVCAGSNNGVVTLSGQTGAVIRWESSTDGSTWTNLSNTGTSQSYVNLTQTTQYRVLVQNGSCTSAYSSVTTITVNQPATIANAGPNDVVCNLTQYQLHGNIPNLGTGQWTVASGQAGITFSNDTLPDAIAMGLIPGNTYRFTWTITAATQCPSSSSSVIIKDDAPAVGGTTAGASTVCSGSNSGAITLSGQFGTILRWESSTDNGTTWVTITNTTTSLSYSNLIQTTQYHAILQNGICSIVSSSVTTIQVNPPAPVADAGPSQNLCNQTATTLSGNDPGAFPGVWRQIAGPPVTFADSTNHITAVTGLTGGNTYIFTWTITALAPCPTIPSQVTVKNSNDVVASFTTVPKSGCGNLAVQFTNTSNSQAGATFVWNFGDGSAPSNVVSPQHTFAQRTDGRDTTYYISLSVSGNCVPRPPVIDSVLVRPATPIARILPNTVSGCGNFALDVKNLSPGNNTAYDFYLYDGATLVQHIPKTDKTNALFNPITTTSPKTFTLYMVATGYCSNTNETVHIPITISPIGIIAQMFVQGNINKGCTPLNVTFVNNSSGGNTFHYNIYDSNNNLVNQIVAGTDPLPYTFNTIGTYYVTISASDNCGTTESTPRTRIDVYAAPKPDFIADVTTGCKDIRVNFTNNTVSNDPNIPASSLSYDWDFGDGTAHSFSYTPPVHAYHYTNSPYTITLTVTNTTTTCSSTLIKQSYIIVNAPPQTAFAEKPDSVTTIPNYTFSFIDQTKGNPVSWKWTFSDGQTSIKQNPLITFPDTGLYKVALTATNVFGCDSTVTHNVRINGVPGQLYLPNAFIPTSLEGDLKIFRAKGSGIKNWHLQIFNSFGELVWETTKLDSKGAPVEGWDGTFNGMPASQGVYVWQASATFINGTEWKGMSYNNSSPKRVGSVHLIR